MEFARRELQLISQHRREMGEAGRVIVALLGKLSTKKITPQVWADAQGVGVQITFDADGGVVVRKQK